MWAGSRWTFFCICCVQIWLCTLFLGEEKSFFSASWFLFVRQLRKHLWQAGKKMTKDWQTPLAEKFSISLQLCIVYFTVNILIHLPLNMLAKRWSTVISIKVSNWWYLVFKGWDLINIYLDKLSLWSGFDVNWRLFLSCLSDVVAVKCLSLLCLFLLKYFLWL